MHVISGSVTSQAICFLGCSKRDRERIKDPRKPYSGSIELKGLTFKLAVSTLHRGLVSICPQYVAFGNGHAKTSKNSSEI